MRRIRTLLITVFLIGSITMGALAAEFPVKPIQLVVPFKPGGGSDVTARIVAEYMKPYLKQPVIVTNIDGAQGRTGEIHVQKAKPDGYTLLWQHQTLHMAYACKRSDYTWEAFTPVVNGVKAYSAVVVTGDSPFKTMSDLIDYMKANPKKVRWGAAPNGTSHFALLSIMAETGIEPHIIPMSGDKDRIISMLGGMMEASAITISSAAPYLASGDLRVLGVMAEERSSLYPEYPTLMEQGINAINRFDYTVFAPAGLPEDVKKILADAFRKALSDPKCIEELGKQWTEPAYLEPAETMELLKKDFRVFNELAEKFNLTS
jgi:tripartite-type tricarboxylate transporter receptor subunit TctC